MNAATIAYVGESVWHVWQQVNAESGWMPISQNKGKWIYLLVNDE